MFILFLSYTVIAQNFDVMRGDKDSLLFSSSVDYTAYKLEFVIKTDKTLTGDRLVEKQNTAMGGDDTEITVTASTIKVFLLKGDTQDFTSVPYYYDLVATLASDATFSKTINYGHVNMIFDVGSPYDGTDLPDDAERYVPVLESNFTADDFVQYNGNEFVGTPISPSGITKINYAEDVDTTNIADDKFMQYSTTTYKWEMVDVSSTGVGSADSLDGKAGSEYMLRVDIPDSLEGIRDTNTAQDALIATNISNIGLKASIASPTFTGTITIGSAEVNEAELEVLDGAALTTAELNRSVGVTSGIQNQLDAITTSMNFEDSLANYGVTSVGINLIEAPLYLPDQTTDYGSTVSAGDVVHLYEGSGKWWQAKNTEGAKIKPTLGICVSSTVVLIRGVYNFGAGTFSGYTRCWLGTSADLVTSAYTDTTHWNRRLGQILNDSLFYFDPEDNAYLLSD